MQSDSYVIVAEGRFSAEGVCEKPRVLFPPPRLTAMLSQDPAGMKGAWIPARWWAHAVMEFAGYEGRTATYRINYTDLIPHTPLWDRIKHLLEKLHTPDNPCESARRYASSVMRQHDIKHMMWRLTDLTVPFLSTMRAKMSTDPKNASLVVEIDETASDIGCAMKDAYDTLHSSNIRHTNIGLEEDVRHPPYPGGLMVYRIRKGVMEELGVTSTTHRHTNPDCRCCFIVNKQGKPKCVPILGFRPKPMVPVPRLHTPGPLDLPHLYLYRLILKYGEGYAWSFYTLYWPHIQAQLDGVRVADAITPPTMRRLVDRIGPRTILMHCLAEFGYSVWFEGLGLYVGAHKTVPVSLQGIGWRYLRHTGDLSQHDTPHNRDVDFYIMERLVRYMHHHALDGTLFGGLTQTDKRGLNELDGGMAMFLSGLYREAVANPDAYPDAHLNPLTSRNHWTDVERLLGDIRGGETF
jgi:hypothetical protein